MSRDIEDNERHPSATQPMNDEELIDALINGGEYESAKAVRRRVDAAKAHRNAIRPPAAPKPAGA